MTIDVCLSPTLYPRYHNADAVTVITDVFRATSTIAAALGNGARSIVPVASTDEAKDYKSKGWLVGAERNVQRCAFADFGNSPFDYTAEKVAGRDIVFTTTNGTKAIHSAANAYCIFTGAFTNLAAVAAACRRERRDVVVLCSGWEDKINVEDTLFGGALAEMLLDAGYTAVGDSANIALTLWKTAKNDLRAVLERTEHYQRLKINGLLRDFEYCISLNQSDIVPFYDAERGCLRADSAIQTVL